jgi:hypothetical protein
LSAACIERRTLFVHHSEVGRNPSSLPSGRGNCVASIQREGTHGDDQEGGPVTPASITPAPQKNPHAAALGRLGGLKGGHARALRLSPAKRREIARKAARARWRKQKS